ncbi:MAG: efflux RND transporter periplasmic adaptor subunit [Terriglobales bacterium]
MSRTLLNEASWTGESASSAFTEPSGRALPPSAFRPQPDPRRPQGAGALGSEHREGVLRRAAAPLAAVLALAAGLAALAGCGASRAANADATGAVGGAAAKATFLTVPEAQMGHIQVVSAAVTNWPRQLRLTGSVDYDQFLTTPVITQVSGPVERILATPGQQVQRGQPLVEVSSPDFAQARTAYLQANAAFSLAQKTLRRDEDLYEHHAIPQTQLEQDQATHDQDQAALAAAAQSLRILGLPDPSPQTVASAGPLLALRAPIAGEVVERDIAPGQLVQANTTQCFVISDMSTVWVLANVYQSDLQYVHVGDPVVISTDAYPTTFRGRIQYLSPTLDPATRTLQARIATRNPNAELKKQMYVTALVTAGSLRNIVVVPNDAVLRDTQNVPFVYVQAAARNQFAQRTVSLGPTENGFTQITGGLMPGEHIVANGGIFLQFASTFQQ